MNDADLNKLREVINVYQEYEHWPDENGWQAVLCADIVVYLAGYSEDPNLAGYGQSPELDAQGILDFYNRSMELVKDDLKWVLINGDGCFRKVTKKVFDMIPFWMSPENTRSGMGVNMQGGPERNGRTDRSFSFHRTYAGTHLRLTLPVEYLLEDPQRFANLARSMVGQLKFATGSAGFSVNMHLDGIGADKQEGSHIYMLSRRFDGLDLGIPWDSSKEAVHGLRTINWLTFVGDPIAERMQGREGVKAALPPDIPVTDLDHGLMIQAGPRPILGDVNRQEDLTDYYRVGRALRPLAFTPDPASDNVYLKGYSNAIGGDENTELWFKRFFQG